MSAHTPGPWRFGGGRYGNNKVEVVAKDARGVSTHLVAAVVAYKPNRDPDGKWRGDLLTEEGVANAHLIAAAPDLLAAVADVVEAIDADGEIDVESLRKLIAKAEGRSS